MRKIALAAALSAALVVGAGASIAAPGPNGNNNHGLCTAYFNGSERGQQQKRKAPPFVALENAADEAGDGDGTATAEEVQNFCAGLIGGRAGKGGSTPGGGSGSGGGGGAGAQGQSKGGGKKG